jgi:hypothetical protein
VHVSVLETSRTRVDASTDASTSFARCGLEGRGLADVSGDGFWHVPVLVSGRTTLPAVSLHRHVVVVVGWWWWWWRRFGYN